MGNEKLSAKNNESVQSEEIDYDIDGILALQADHLDKVQKSLVNHKKTTAPNRRTKANFESRLETLVQHQSNFQANHRKLVQMVTNQNEYEYFTKDEYSEFEETFIEVYSYIVDDMEKTCSPTLPSFTQSTPDTPRSTVSESTHKSIVKFPEIKLPSFSGNYIDWQTFHGTFDRLIHKNILLSRTEKFHYLLGALHEDVIKEIQHLDIDDNNYSVAYELLEQRYSNKRVIFSHFMKILCATTLHSETADSIKQLHDTSRACVNALKKLDIDLDNSDQILVYFLVQRLPRETHTLWEQHLGSSTAIPNFEQFRQFLEIRYRTLESIESKNNFSPTTNNLRSQQSNTNHHSKSSFHKNSFKRSEIKSTNTVQQQKSNQWKCVHCNDSHSLHQCPTFLGLDNFERKAVVDKARLCLNCFSNKHFLKQCTSSHNCRHCGKRHHTMIHFPMQTNPPNNNSIASSPESSNSSNSLQHVSLPVGSERITLLPTAVVKARNANGQTILLRALVDQGSQISLVTERVTQILGLKKQNISATVTGVGVHSQKPSHAVKFEITSLIDPNFALELDTIVLKHLTADLPTRSFSPPSWPLLANLKLADPTYYRTGTIDLILGSDVYPQIILKGEELDASQQFLAKETKFGWILSGNVPNTFRSHHISVTCFHSTAELENLVKRFHEIEDVPDTPSLTQEEQWCEDFFKSTHIRQPNGKYLVRLPLKTFFDPSLTLGKSYHSARKRLFAMERRLQSDSNLAQEYHDQLQEYLDLDQMLLVNTTEAQHHTLNSNGKTTFTCSYLPHHPVITSKVRIVFDASAKSTHGTSLNDILCVGPKLHADLPAIILNWRLPKFVFTADIKQMYRCIDMNETDAEYQRILWRDKHGEIQSYRLNTVTFGTASAPFTAIRVLHQLATDETDRFPLAKNVLTTQTYMDDICAGHDSIAKALQVRNDVIGALHSAGFPLRKWASNATELLESIPIAHRKNEVFFDSDKSIKALGMYWQPNEDYFSFQINFDIDSNIVTKRTTLSTIARLFDPLGFISPIIIVGKVIHKHIWLAGSEWDDTVSDELQTAWRKYTENLKQLVHLRIPRWINVSDNIKSCELHVFCDGSLNAYASVIYLRIETENHQIHSHFITSKTRVTPTKVLTVPCIELCAAVLGTRLAFWVTKHIQLPIPLTSSYFWTDATIVLSWIRNNGNTKRQIFVANRLKTILEKTQSNQWHHIGTTENPSDCATRGLTPSQLSAFDLWWHGPPWLSKAHSEWPKTDWTFLEFDENPTETITQSVLSISKTDSFFIHRYSSYNRLLRITAYMLRFVHNCKQNKIENRKLNELSVTEHKLALTVLIRTVQHECFSKELNLIIKKQSLPNGNKLIGLAPFLDSHNLLRVRGRLQNTNLRYDQKHPMILPSAHHFVTILINDYHKRTLHGGTQLILAEIRKSFWILNARRTIATQVKKCVKCFRHKPDLATQLMGNLPVHRCNPSTRPFTAVGIDCTGAIELRASKFRGNTLYKGYIVLFVCLSTKAIHLEAVTGMTTDLFLEAFDRFVGRRGKPHDIYSDNGTNFLGASKIFDKTLIAFEKAIKGDIIPKLSVQQINWHFIPPASPNFGGLWEANIRSMKHHLKRVTDGTTLTFEQLSTVLIRIEACLNSRPLCPLSNDPDDLLFLTPGHFLIGDSLLAAPEIPIDYSPVRRYQCMQQMVQQFWKQWSSDWLSHLQSRPKWCKEQENLKLNDIVMMKDDRLPPQQWLLGRIVKVILGKDGLARVFSVKTKNGIFDRSISKIAKLPIPTHLDASEESDELSVST